MTESIVEGGVEQIGTRIGVYGGTFDPVHNGHCALVRQFKQQCGLDSVIVIPAANPPHKLSQSLSDFEHRFAMLSLVFAECGDVFLSRLEQFRAGPSFTIDTLRYLKTVICGQREWFFAVGEDSLAEMYTWKEYRAVPEEACLVSFPRNVPLSEPVVETVRRIFPDYSLATNLLAHNAVSFCRDGAEKIRLLTMPTVDVSSSQIRKAIAANEDCSGQLAEAVLSYVHEHSLYK